MDEERDWVERAVQGDAEAIASLYRRYAPAIWRYLYYRLGDHEAADDLTSEVFLRVLRSLPRYRQRGRPFSAWLYRIAGARLVDHYRRRRPTVPLEPETRAGRRGPEQEAERRLAAEELRQAMGQLKPAYQQVLFLRFVEGVSHAEVARLLERSEGAVRVLQFRALRALRQILEKGAADGGADGG